MPTPPTTTIETGADEHGQTLMITQRPVGTITRPTVRMLCSKQPSGALELRIYDADSYEGAAISADADVARALQRLLAFSFPSHASVPMLLVENESLRQALALVACPEEGLVRAADAARAMNAVVERYLTELRKELTEARSVNAAQPSAIIGLADTISIIEMLSAQLSEAVAALPPRPIAAAIPETKRPDAEPAAP